VATYDTSALLAEIRRRAAAPVSSSSAPGFQDADLLAFANGIIPGIQDKLRRVRTNYFATQKDVPFVAGTASYRIPTRAQHGVVSLVQRLTSTGELKHLTKWTERDMDGRNPTTTGAPANYLWRGGSLVLWPVPDNASESLRFTYHRRVNTLVSATTCGQAIGGIGGLTLVLQDYTAAALGITTSTPLDFLQTEPPFDTVADSATPTSTSTYGLSFASGVIPTEMLPIAYGGTGARYYVCLAGQAPVIQMPEQAFYVVAQAVACALLSEDAAALPAATRLLGMLETDLYGGANDRDDGEPDSAACETWA
jgi:hypothetical protein